MSECAFWMESITNFSLHLIYSDTGGGISVLCLPNIRHAIDGAAERCHLRLRKKPAVVWTACMPFPSSNLLHSDGDLTSDR